MEEYANEVKELEEANKHRASRGQENESVEPKKVPEITQSQSTKKEVENGK